MMKSYCLYSLINIDSSCSYKQLGYNLDYHFLLSKIFYHFHHYITNAYRYINRHFEKPKRELFQQYRIVPLSLHLNQWQIANEIESLIQLHYTQIKKNPE